jgi:predicted transcriptional regulator
MFGKKPPHWPSGFENCGERKMKTKNAVSKKTEAGYVKLGTGSVEAFFERSLARVRKLDRGEKLPTEMRITFEDPSDLMRVLSAQRVRVLHTVRMKPTPISGLAAMLKRDRKAVSRDVKVLESFGLVKTHQESNPGHGMMKVVEPLAAKYQLVTII